MATSALKLTDPFKCLHCPVHTPEEAYYFFPSQDDEVELNFCNTNNPRRSVFEKLTLDEYLPFENEKFKELEEYIEQNHKDLILPKDWKRTETMKCLQSAAFQMKNAVERIKAQLNYPLPQILYEKYEEILHSNFLYMNGLDCNYRPILITNASTYMELNKTHSKDDFIVAITVFLKYLADHFFIPGQVENWVMIGDLAGISIIKPPISMMNVFGYIQTKYLCRLYKLYIYGMNSFLNMCWKIVKKVVDSTTTTKFIFVDESNKHLIFNHVHYSQLEEKYGGTAPNMPVHLDIPFNIPKGGTYLVNQSKEKIISKKEYINRAINNKLVVVSPYLERIISDYQNAQKDGKEVIVLDEEKSMFFECNSDYQNDSDQEANDKCKDNHFVDDSSANGGAVTYNSDFINKEGLFKDKLIPSRKKNPQNLVLETIQEQPGCCRVACCTMF